MKRKILILIDLKAKIVIYTLVSKLNMVAIQKKHNLLNLINLLQMMKSENFR